MSSRRRGEIRQVSERELEQRLATPADGAEGTDGAERRSDARQRAHLAVEIALSPDELQAVYTANISRGGLMFWVAPPVSLPSSVELTLELPDGQRVQLAGEVRHVGRSGLTEEPMCEVGVQFRSISDEARAKLERALRSFAQA